MLEMIIHITLIQQTSMSSMFVNNGASIMFLSTKLSDSISNLCFVISSILFQCLSFIALSAMRSNTGHTALKSSIFFVKSLNACHSFNAFGSLRHLFWNSNNSLLIFSISTYSNIQTIMYCKYLAWVTIDWLIDQQVIVNVVFVYCQLCISIILSLYTSNHKMSKYPSTLSMTLL